MFELSKLENDITNYAEMLCPDDLRPMSFYNEVEMDDANAFDLLKKERRSSGQRTFELRLDPETIFLICVGDVETTYHP